MSTILAPSRADARQLILTEGQAHTCVVYFTKKDGTTRRMVCRYFDGTSRKPHLMTVLDIEKGAPRTVNLDAVQRIVVLRPREDRPAIAPQRPEAPEQVPTAPQSVAEWKAQYAGLLF